MVPTKVSNRLHCPIAARRSMTTRSQNGHAIPLMDAKAKRKADSPAKGMTLKRSALGDVTNALKKTLAHNEKANKKVIANPVKKVTVQTKELPTVKTVTKPKQNENLVPPAQPKKKIVTRASLKSIVPIEPHTQTTVTKPKEAHVVEKKVKTRLSNEFDKTDESLYTSALENLNESNKSTCTRSGLRSQKPSPKNGITKHSPVLPQNGAVKHASSPVKVEKKINRNIGDHNVPKGVPNFDKENWNDIHQVSHYAMDIFNYMKIRESRFIIKPYMEKQVCLTNWMRSLLVDWMIEVQESFELNHETLYLAVKLVDYYLSKVVVSKETLQLVGAASMFIASKYDERIPPLIDDFLYICDGAYSRRELLRMEINVLKIANFDLGIPLSYRFLRRYARCAKVSMLVLTLARFILEHALMDYQIVTFSDSKLAAAALYLALRMKNISKWTPTLEFYTGYKLEEFSSMVKVLHNGLQKKPKEQLSTVRNKYSHKIFFEVAKTPLLSREELENDI